MTEAILRETVRLLGDVGYAGMSLEAVAKAAGVGKTAIYRRFRDKAELSATAMAMLRRVDEPVDTGSARTDLIAQMERSVHAMVAGPGLAMMGTILVESKRNPELIEAFRDRIILPLFAASREAMHRGVARGEVRADADVDAAIEAAFGQIVTRFFTGEGYDARFAERAVDLVWSGVAATARPGRARSSRKRSE